MGQQGVLVKMGAPPLEAQCLRFLLVGLRLASWNLATWQRFGRRLALHVHGFFFCSCWLLCSLDVHYQLHAFSALEPVLGRGPCSYLAYLAQLHGFCPGR